MERRRKGQIWEMRAPAENDADRGIEEGSRQVAHFCLKAFDKEQARWYEDYIKP
jgi:hypothetical protein